MDSFRFPIFIKLSLAIVLMGLGQRTRGQDQPAAAEKTPENIHRVTRVDLAASYLRFEQAIAAHPPAPERLAEISKGFDLATLSFFQNKQDDAIRQINALTASLLPGQPPSVTWIAGAAVKNIGQERIWPYANWTMAIYPRLVSMYDVNLPGEGETEFHLRIRDDLGQIPTFLDQPFSVTNGTTTTIDAPIHGMFADDLVSGGYDVEIAGPNDEVFHFARWYVVPRALKEIREENEKLLSGIKAETPQLKLALATCRARNSILDEKSIDTSTILLLADPNKLINDLEKEIESLAAGKDPYFRRTGDYWRVLPASPRDVPCRVYAPPSAAKDDPMPLLVALHGAGGDENMFMDGYGAGMIKKLADENNFIVASPVSNPIANGDNFEKLAEALSCDYAIDSKRIYVLGHSMGAGVTAGLARKKYDKIRAACCLAGGSFSTEDKLIAPTLAIAAELDMVIPLARLQPGIEKAAAAGLPIEFRIIKNYGHTLVVGAQLPDAVKWLLEHK
ncbi:hypothetical protein HYR69_01540 [Candidatus Sumerlaeota bacterium]|nr:hypothetical protein [Candidatus Sumerlaeota bacterium]